MDTDYFKKIIEDTATNTAQLSKIVADTATNSARLGDLQTHFTNHLQHHEQSEKEIKRYCFAMLTIVITAAITGSGSLVVGLLLLFMKFK
jgi:hypothetical protein